MPDNRNKQNSKGQNNTDPKQNKQNKKRSTKTFVRKLKLLFNELFKPRKKNSSTDSKSNLELVKGSRKRKLIIRIVFYSLIVVLIVVVIVLNVSAPTGLIEQIQNGYAAMGKGEFPINVYAQNPDEMISNGDVACILNDTYLEVYNKNGKLVNAVSHGMFDPCLEISEARFLLFDRDRYSVKVLNYSSELYTRTFDKTVCSADIGRDGTFAVVTTSDTHNNTVYVYNKENEQIFSWNSAEYYVMDVAVADNGESVAVCLANASAGSFVSSVCILEYDSASPVYRQEFDALISSLTSVNENYFIANGIDCAYTVDWTGSCRELEFSGAVRYFGSEFDGISCFVCGREDNEQVNSILIIDEVGNNISSFEFNAPVSDICALLDKVLILSDDTVYIYSVSGSLLQQLKSDTKPLFATFNKDGNILIIDNSQLKMLAVPSEE